MRQNVIQTLSISFKSTICLEIYETCQIVGYVMQVWWGWEGSHNWGRVSKRQISHVELKKSPICLCRTRIQFWLFSHCRTIWDTNFLIYFFQCQKELLESWQSSRVFSFLFLRAGDLCSLQDLRWFLCLEVLYLNISYLLVSVPGNLLSPFLCCAFGSSLLQWVMLLAGLGHLLAAL